MQCPMCRSIIRDGAAQCPVCGAAAHTTAPTMQQASGLQTERRMLYQRQLLPPTETPRPVPVARPRGYGLVTVAVAVLIIGAAVLAGWFLSAGKRRAAAVYPLGSRERILKVGDRWTYRVSAKVTMLGNEMADVKGTVERQVQKSRFFPGALQDKYVIKFEGRGIPGMPVFHLTRTLVQDPKSGEVRIIGVHDHAGRFKRIAQPGIVETGLWYLERSNTYNIRYEDGAAEVLAERVTGTELVSTPAGKFHAWKVEMGYEAATTMLAASGTGTMAYVPQLGSSAYEKISLTGPMGITADGELYLESTNVAVDRVVSDSLKPALPTDPGLLIRAGSGDRVR